MSPAQRAATERIATRTVFRVSPALSRVSLTREKLDRFFLDM